jgi:hypothetical protein
MPIAYKSNHEGIQEYPGLTSGNGVAVSAPPWANETTVEYIPTSAGTASLKVSLFPSGNADAAEFLKTNVGDVTAHGMQVVGKVTWLAFIPESGTWTARFLFKR